MGTKKRGKKRGTKNIGTNCPPPLIDEPDHSWGNKQ